MDQQAEEDDGTTKKNPDVVRTSLFDRERHIAYFSACLRKLPTAYEKMDTNRLTLVHFCVHALDLLGFWDDHDDNAGDEQVESPSPSPSSSEFSLTLSKATIIEWIYSLQTTTATDDSDAPNSKICGFKGGTFLGRRPSVHYDHGHIAMTYTALATLRTLGDDLSRVDKSGILQALRNLQLPDGSFQAVGVGSEHDMRFLYCACCISFMLNDWSYIDTDKAVDYIRACRSWDGAFALLPGQEGHGGSTFCAVASLVLMDQCGEVLDTPEHWRQDLIRWCVHRQVAGMQGRPNKAEDTCYSYWIGGTLRLLGRDDLLDHEQLREFVMKCQTPMGGFSKVIGIHPDVLHAFYSLSYLSLSQNHFRGDGRDDPDNEYGIDLKQINCTLGFCQERALTFGALPYP